MLTFREIQSCEGYYYNVETGDILRIVGPGETRCWSEGSWKETDFTTDVDARQFELVANDVLVPFETIQGYIASKYGRGAPERLLNRQTAIQPDGRVITEEAETPKGPVSTPGGQGFTMVEMLTVIAVIAILAAILFPVFATARRNAYKAQCTSNLHSIAQGLKLFKDDHGAYPEALYGFVDAGTKQERTFLYPRHVKTRQEFRCPLAPYQIDDPGAPTAVATPPTGRLFPNHPKRIYPAWDSYDGHFEPPQNPSNYVVTYVKHWSSQKPGFGDERRQLLYKNPPEDTVVTWCAYHRDYDRSTGEPQTGSIDLVLFIDISGNEPGAKRENDFC